MTQFIVTVVALVLILVVVVRDLIKNSQSRRANHTTRTRLLEIVRELNKLTITKGVDTNVRSSKS